MTVRTMSCGIAMCTCNGAAYLDEQLRSLVNQTRLPVHIVVGDDNSDDGTWQILNAWAEAVRSEKGIRVTLLRNESRLGVTRNFQRAIEAVDADIVFLADQDDIWIPNKIEVLASHLEHDENILLVHSDALLIDRNGESLERSLFEALHLTVTDRELVQQQRFFEVYCRRNLVTGTTAAFRRQLLELALPFPVDWIHDEWLAACAASWKNVAMLSDQLTLYRQHGLNAIGVPTGRLSWIVNYARRVMRTPRDEYFDRKLSRLGVLRERLNRRDLARGDALELVEQAESHFARRKAFRRNPVCRVVSIIREARTNGYRRFADGVAGMVRDLIRL